MNRDYDPLYVQFIHYFNIERDYFECHEVMEELWLEEGRDPVYQGLLQVAVGLYHDANGNRNGAIKLFAQALDKLEGVQDERLGIDLEKLVNDSRTYYRKLSRAMDEPFEPYDLDIVILDSKLRTAVERLAGSATE
ncbi:DUF309 domain-containing protein [Paenibacillus ginsengihumi]|uniref:DUF309 domain-containing protein n=1 Tax=Paenibacillus ginsengihumi TaxID=431596 RepID=UPI000372C0E7|nr:DUF309 domain-containing protein [Paenibacillus ginsengihumi]